MSDFTLSTSISFILRILTEQGVIAFWIALRQVSRFHKILRSWIFAICKIAGLRGCWYGEKKKENIINGQMYMELGRTGIQFQKAWRTIERDFFVYLSYIFLFRIIKIALKKPNKELLMVLKNILQWVYKFCNLRIRTIYSKNIVQFISKIRSEEFFETIMLNNLINIARVRCSRASKCTSWHSKR